MTNETLPSLRDSHQIREEDAQILLKIVTKGDYSDLSAPERLQLILRVCEVCHLSPVTQPIQFIKTSQGLKLYANATAAWQLCEDRHINARPIKDELLTIHDKLYYKVTSEAISLETGRSTTRFGILCLHGLDGDDVSNTMMKCETKASRRAVLALCGLGILDESEIETLPDAKPLPAPQPGNGSESADYQAYFAQFHTLCDEIGIPKLNKARRDYMIACFDREKQEQIRAQDETGKKWVPAKEDLAFVCARMKQQAKFQASPTGEKETTTEETLTESIFES